MQISAAPILYILIFVAVIVLVQGLYLTVFGKSISLNNRVSRRLQLLEKKPQRRVATALAVSHRLQAMQRALSIDFGPDTDVPPSVDPVSGGASAAASESPPPVLQRKLRAILTPCSPNILMTPHASRHGGED